METSFGGHSLSICLKFRNNLHTYPIGDELLIFDGLTKRLFRNNPTATLIWKGLHTGLSPKEIISVLSDTTGAGIDQIASDVNNITSHWRKMGLLLDSRGLPVIHRQTPAPEQPLNGADYDGPVPQPPSTNHEYKFRIIDTCFQISTPTENELNIVIPLFNHLSVARDNTVDEHLQIVRTDDRYVLLHNKKVINWCFHISGIAPMLHGHALVIAYELSHCLFGIHAAAVLFREKCVLMPALAGSGKSTLTAALVGSGASLCADDLVLLTPAPVRMRSVPVVIGIKSGSWDLLMPYHPNIASLPTHSRADDKHIRYLAPPADSMVPMTSQPFPIDIIVFPNVVDGSDSLDVKEISAADGLCRLTDAGYDIRGEMTASCVKQLVDWITHIPCYEMYFNRLDKAISAIQTLVS